MRKPSLTIAFSLSPHRRLDRSSAVGKNQCVVSRCDAAGEKRTYWQDIWSQNLRDPLAYRLQDIRDCGLSESPHEMAILFSMVMKTTQFNYSSGAQKWRPSGNVNR